jgi:hypothetical protein
VGCCRPLPPGKASAASRLRTRDGESHRVSSRTGGLGRTPVHVDPVQLHLRAAGFASGRIDRISSLVRYAAGRAERSLTARAINDHPSRQLTALSHNAIKNGFIGQHSQNGSESPLQRWGAGDGTPDSAWAVGGIGKHRRCRASSPAPDNIFQGYRMTGWNGFGICQSHSNNHFGADISWRQTSMSSLDANYFNARSTPKIWS